MTPVVSAAIKFGCNFFGKTKALENQPSKNAPDKLISKVPIGNSLPQIFTAKVDNKKRNRLPNTPPTPTNQ